MNRIPSRRAAGALAAAAALVLCAPVAAIGRLADIEVVDRDSGRRLTVYRAHGRHWVAGEPGRRYAVAIRNRLGERLLAVVAVDGVNVVTGETAAWSQGGYVFGPKESWQVTGWRKSLSRVAAFEFTALPEAYATLTGRPDHVGVIGVAVFRERRLPPPPPPTTVQPDPADAASSKLRDAARAATQAEAARGRESASERLERPFFDSDRFAAAELPMPADPDRASAGARTPPEVREPSRLGTGHGRSESSLVGTTSFERAGASPEEIITLHYDRTERLVAMGVIPSPLAIAPRAFPASPGPADFVPDPPRR